MKIRAGPQPFVQIIFVFLSAAKSDKFLGEEAYRRLEIFSICGMVE
jgi:hypothetical protein